MWAFPNKSIPNPAIKVIAIDFDGTLHDGSYPGIGVPDLDLINALRYTRACGHEIILNTCRTGTLLDEAVLWCAKHKLHFNYVNENSRRRIAEYGGDCRKISADLYIDDRNAGHSMDAVLMRLSQICSGNDE